MFQLSRHAINVADFNGLGGHATVSARFLMMRGRPWSRSPAFGSCFFCLSKVNRKKETDLAVMRQLALQRIGAHLASVSRIHRSSSYFALRPTAAEAVAAFEPALTLAAAAVVMLSYLDAR